MLLDAFIEKDNNEWGKVRFLAFHNYQSVVDFGKQPWNKVYKTPQDIFKLPSDPKPIKAKRDNERASKAIKRHRELQKNK